jgi:hypothetical protein
MEGKQCENNNLRRLRKTQRQFEDVLYKMECRLRKGVRECNLKNY